jgi:hypothetical protein
MRYMIEGEMTGYTRTGNVAVGPRAGEVVAATHIVSHWSRNHGKQLRTADPDAGPDRPLRLPLRQDANGAVWAEHTDFAWIARLHRIQDRDAAFAMAAKVIASITGARLAVDGGWTAH